MVLGGCRSFPLLVTTDFRPSRSAYRDAVFTGFTSKILLRSQIF